MSTVGSILGGRATGVDIPVKSEVLIQLST